MKKIKFLIASMFGAIALVFACVFGTRINAATGTYVDKTYDSTAANTGWTYSDVSSKSDFTYNSANISVGKLGDGKSIISPTFSSASSVTVSIVCGTTASSSAKKFTLYGYHGTTLIDEVDGYTPLSKAMGQACTNSSGTAGDFILEMDDDSITHFEVKVTGGSNVNFLSISYSTVDYVDDTTKYNVTYNNNNHGESIDSIEVSKLTASSLPELSAAGYNFGGWFYDNGKFENEATAGDEITEDTVLYAKWTAVAQYAVTYDVDGQTTSTNVNAGTVITLDEAPLKANSVFNGWSDGTTTYAAGASYTVNSAVTFAATWTTYSGGNGVSFTAGDLYGTYPNTIKNQMVVSGTIFTIYADSSKTVTFDNSKITLSDGSTEINGRLKLGGTADFTNTLRVIGFTAPSNGTVNVEFVSGSSNSSRNLVVKDSSGNQIISVSNSSSSNAVCLTANVESGKIYYIGSGNNGINIGKVEFVEASEPKMSDGTTASVFAEMNNTTGTLRFVGTLTGITSLDNIASIELVLKKKSSADTDYVATKSKIYLTTCYTSVTGTTQTCAASNGKYYVIFRLNNADSLATGTKISKELIITFTDGSTTTSGVSDFDM